MTNELLNNSEKRENIPLMKAILGPEIGKSFFVSKPLVTFGRGEDRDLKFNDRAMSRKHGEIIFLEGRLIIRDTGSQNGIKINGRTTMEQELEDGEAGQRGIKELPGPQDVGIEHFVGNPMIFLQFFRADFSGGVLFGAEYSFNQFGLMVRHTIRHPFCPGAGRQAGRGVFSRSR